MQGPASGRTSPPGAAPRSGRLQRKVLLALIVSLLLGISCAGVVSYHYQRGLLVQALEGRAGSISRTLAAVVQDAVIRRHYATIERYIHQVAREEPGIVLARIRTEEGAVLAEGAGLPDRETVDFSRRVEVQGQVFGVLELRFSTREIRAALANLRISMLAFALLVTGGLWILLGVQINRQVLRPLERLQRFAVRMREGDLEAVVPVESQDEIGTLSRALNEMAGAIRTRNEKLQVSHRTILASFARLRAILGGLSEGVLVINARGRVLLANREAEGIFGARKGELLGRPILEAFPPQARELLERRVGSPGPARRGPAGVEEELTFQRHHRDFRVGVAPVVTPGGNFSGTALVLQDVTRLMELGRMKDDFISSVSHELRTPLSSIKSFAEILLTYADEDPAVRREFLEIIHRESQRLTRLINDILDVSKIEAGKLEWREEEVRVEELARETARALEPAARARDIRLVLEPAEVLPEVRGDRDRLAQVFTNLLGNAIKFTPPQGEVRVRFQKDLPEGFLRVEIADTGPGIAREDLLLIFEKFHQTGDTLRSKPHGTGLGLHICRLIVTRLGGEIWAESELGRGSRFIFTLPVRAAPAPSASAPVQEPSAGEAQASVLVVDDDANFRKFIRFELVRLGFRLHEAATGREGLKLARERRPDLVALDLLLEDVSGREVARELRQDPATRDIPILMISILEDRELRAGSPADGFLSKPVAPRDLLARIGTLLSRSRPLCLLVGLRPPLQEELVGALREAGLIPLALPADNGASADLLDADTRIEAVVADLSERWEAGLLRIRDFRVRLGPRKIPLILITRGGGEEESRTLAALGPSALLPADVRAEKVLEALRITVPGPGPGEAPEPREEPLALPAAEVASTRPA